MREKKTVAPVCSLPDRAVHAMPVARAAFFATRLTLAPVLRRVRFADFKTFVVLDFLRLAILSPPVRYLIGPSPRPLCEAVIVQQPASSRLWISGFRSCRAMARASSACYCQSGSLK
jgi:hypothetical protein